MCEQCLEGKFVAGEGQQQCTPCPAGQYSNVPFTSQVRETSLWMSIVRSKNRFGHPLNGLISFYSSLLQCLNCEPGRFAPETGLSACRNCLPGYYTNLTSQVRST